MAIIPDALSLLCSVICLKHNLTTEGKVDEHA